MIALEIIAGVAVLVLIGAIVGTIIAGSSAHERSVSISNEHAAAMRRVGELETLLNARLQYERGLHLPKCTHFLSTSAEIGAPGCTCEIVTKK